MTKVEFSWINVDVEWPLIAESSEAEERADCGPRIPLKCRPTRLSLSTDTARKSLSLEAPCSRSSDVSSNPSWLADLERVLEKRRRIDVKISPLLVLLRPLSVNYHMNISYFIIIMASTPTPMHTVHCSHATQCMYTSVQHDKWSPGRSVTRHRRIIIRSSTIHHSTHLHHIDPLTPSQLLLCPSVGPTEWKKYTKNVYFPVDIYRSTTLVLPSRPCPFVLLSRWLSKHITFLGTSNVKTKM